jgi:PAS domain S-box-containing protein
MTTERGYQVRDRAALLLAALVAVNSVVVLVGWSTGWPAFVLPSPSFIPMAPTTALALLALSLALTARLPPPRRTVLRNIATVLACIVATMAVVNLTVPAMLDRALGGGGQLGSLQLGVMSPLTAAALIPLALAIAATDHWPRYTGPFALVAIVVGGTVALGYAYGAPLLYGGGTIPVALPTGLSLVSLGVATVLVAGPRVWPFEPLTGDGPRARMLRAFLPATVGLIVLIGLLDTRFAAVFGADRVLVAAWLAVVSATLVALLVARLARRIARDIDRAYAERHRAERSYRALFEQSLAGVSTTRVSDGRILLCNDRLAKIFGYDSTADFAAVPARKHWWNPDERDRMLATLRESRVLRNYEVHMRRKDGASLWLLCNITLHQGDDGQELLENIVVDVTERKLLQEQLWHAQKLDALGGLAGGVAHDFNNLLTAIMGYADMLREDLCQEPHQATVNEIIRASDRASALTRQLLAFSRRQPSDPKPLRLDRCVSDMETMLRRLLGPSVRLVTATGEDLPAIMADPSQVEQVLLNLTVNSRDAMPPPHGGTLTIETRHVRLDEPCTTATSTVPPGAYVMLAVSDSGTGMCAQTLARAFEPLFTTKERGKGTGLGLSTVYGIVKQSNGHVLVESEPGVGTTFRCYFPVTERRERVSRPIHLPAKIKGTETILLVEDEASIRDLATTALHRLGYRVLPAEDGIEAMTIAAVHDGPIHLLVSDGVLSDVRAADVLRRLTAQRPETRVLLMSGYPQQAVLQTDSVAPNTTFLPKPFTIRQLTERVREVLDN